MSADIGLQGRPVMLGNIPCGREYPPVLVAELGINYAYNESEDFLGNILSMINLAKMAGADIVKVQKRTPRVCVPRDEWYKCRSTPWGEMDYIAYKEKLEFDAVAYDTINAECKRLKIPWFASVWDLESLAFLEPYDLPCYKIGSASLTDWELVKATVDTGKPVIMSTGMSTETEIFRAIWHLSRAWDRLVLCHSTSIYPCPKEKLNLKMIQTLQRDYPKLVIGYSGHEVDGRVTPAAVALGASYIERHFTLDRRGWGTDQAASLEHWQFKQMADRIHETWFSLGNGIKEVYPEEEAKKVSLRRTDAAQEGKEQEDSQSQHQEVEERGTQAVSGCGDSSLNG